MQQPQDRWPPGPVTVPDSCWADLGPCLGIWGGKAVDSRGQLLFTLLPSREGTGPRQSPQGTHPPALLLGRVQGTTAWQRLWLCPVCVPRVQADQAHREQRHQNQGAGGGQGLQVGMASGQKWTQGFAAKGRQGAQEGCRPEGGASGERACVSHLEGLNRCWKEAPEVGEWLLGPPFQQQGDLGMGQGSEPFL